MSYSEFGLDVVKKSQDAGQIQKQYYCPWTWQHVTGRNFYLCFQNWVISCTAIEAFQKQEPATPLEGDQCIKCRKRDIPLHYYIEGGPEEGTPIGICNECVMWAAEYLEKEPLAPEGTQLKLL